MLVAATALIACDATAEELPTGLDCFEQSRRMQQRAHERSLEERVDPRSLAGLHERFAARPHRAGTPGDHAVIAGLEKFFRENRLELRLEWLDLHLCEPVDATLELLVDGEKPRQFPLREPPLDADPATADTTLDAAWHAWSGSGEVTAEVVYAHYARPDDFSLLDKRGIDLAGKIVLAKNGRGYRGGKARRAEAAGAAGLLLYSDPARGGTDARSPQTAPYPAGPGVNPQAMERGCIATLAWDGDPLTPGVAAAENAPRLDPAEVPFPRILSQPVSATAAAAIVAAMRGEAAAPRWDAGLGPATRLTSGPDVRVRLAVDQQQRILRSANVIGILPGAAEDPALAKQLVIAGCHHDAWTHGASDPTAGLIVLLEAARVLAAEAEAGRPPQRTILFACWAAEEYGLVGSTEWVEAHRDRLVRDGVAYLNLDMAAMGPDFSPAASPELAGAVVAAAGSVRGIDHRSIHAAWLERSLAAGEGPPRPGLPGGGSDHVPFRCIAGLPACSLYAGGSQGLAYHTAHDTLRWYRLAVGDDYAPAAMLARLTAVVLSRLAGADRLPLDSSALLRHLAGECERLAAGAADAGLATAATQLARLGRRFADPPEELRRCDALQLRRRFLCDGLPGRPWYRSLLEASCADGYAAVWLPAVAEAIDAADPAAAAAAIGELEAAIDAAR